MLFRPAPTLFVSQFAAQAAFLAPVPVLPDIARDLGVSVATAGQLRTLSGVAAGAAALAARALARRLGVRRMLLLGLWLIAVGAAASAAAPSFAVLAAAQPAIGAGIAVVLAGGWSAAAAWAPPAARARLLGWTILGQPAAWVAGMPLIGLVTADDWRWAWIVLPFAAAVISALAVARRPPDAPAARADHGERTPLREPAVAAWALSEFVTYIAWGAVLVYAGAFFLSTFGLSAAAASLILGAAATGFFPGTLLARRFAEGHARAMLVGSGLAAGVTVVVLARAPVSPAASTVVFGVLMGLIGARTIAAGAFDLHAPPDRRAAVMGVRAAAIQFGNLLGAAAGGAALATGGYRLWSLMAGALFALATTPHLRGVGITARRRAVTVPAAT